MGVTQWRTSILQFAYLALGDIGVLLYMLRILTIKARLHFILLNLHGAEVGPRMILVQLDDPYLKWLSSEITTQ